ncbi:alpha/beta fold hydrolase [Agarivorans sp. TSD2052]|uniref:alpha/beta fold hydrolase n=1 Tax=Agarivorans sp. TSD2052 TaxID=2937286 RepID=UPI00200BABB3|nr:alpha/beta fold hydrolase [Agarivorans sp. TSD2052]UPW17392.1 alpha/beta fold hydrolase [Agarivorans sp. TSD2052]
MRNTEPLPETLIGKIYDTSLNPAQWPELLEQLVEYLPLQAQQLTGEHAMLGSEGQLSTCVVPSPNKVLDELVAHLERSAHICQQIAKGQDQQLLQNKLFEQLPLPALLLSSTGQVLQTNQQARNTLEKTTSLKVSDAKVVMAQRQVQRQFNQAMEQLCAPNPKHSSISLQVGESFQPNSISLNLSRVVDVWQQGGQVLVLIACAEALVEVDLDSFAARYRLTPAEVRIMAQLLKERTLSQIASNNTISINTVRTQLKAIFAKTACHRQSELIKLALTHGSTKTAKPQLTPSLLQQQHLSAPCYHQQLRLDDRQHAYSDVGLSSDLPVLMFHPSTGSRLQQHPNKNTVFEQGVRLITADRAGFGLASTNYKPSLQQSAKDSLRLADHLKLDRFCVAGFCGGGPFALALAALAPDRVIHTTLISSVTPYQPIKLLHGVKASNKLLAYIGLNAPNIMHPLLTFLARNVMSDPERYFDQVYPFLCESDAAALSEPEVTSNFLLAFREAMRQGPSAFANELSLLSQDWSLNLSEINSPISIWHGAQDQHVPIQLARLLCSALPNAKLHELPAHGHLLIYHCWEQVLNNIKRSAKRPQTCLA